jgi:hypothetical protein
MHRPVQVAHSLFTGGLHMTKNMVSDEISKKGMEKFETLKFEKVLNN